MKMNTILKAAALFAVGLAFASCSKEFNYTPAEPEDSSKTYVSVEMGASRSLDIDGSDIIVPFTRNNASGDLEVNVVLEDPSGLFSLRSATVKFENGSTSASAAVGYDYDALDPNAVYNFSVRMTSTEYASEYTAVAFPVSCKKAWQNLGMAQWYDDWWIGGPFEKQLLKAPDGSETYRLVNPWDKQSVIDGGLTFVSELPYLEFVIEEDGSITWGSLLNLGFTFSGMTCHMLHPSRQNDAEGAAMNVMVMDDVAQFCWYPILDYSGGSFRWWGEFSVAYISFPGGPDLEELLEELL